MAINKNFVIRNGLEVATNLIIADDVRDKVGIGTTFPLVELDVRGDVSAYRFYGDQVQYPDWQFFGNLEGTARRSLETENADTADFATEAGNAETADFATEAGNAETANFATEAGNSQTSVQAGTATNADNIFITDTSSNSTHYIHFNDATSGYDNVNISSNRLVFNPSSGNLGVNATNPLTNLQLNFYGFETGFGSFNSVGIGASVIDSYSLTSSDFKVAEYTLLIQNENNIQTQKVLIMQNGVVPYLQEFCIMYEPRMIVSVASSITSGNCTLQLTPLPGISGDISYKFSRQTML